MAEIGEFTKYILVFVSSLTGGVSGYFYSNSPDNLRTYLERSKTRLLRPSDPLWMYKRVLRQNSAKIKEELKELTKFTENTGAEPTEDQAYELLELCNKYLSGKSWDKQEIVKKYCKYPE
ncbi:hypothetical protein A6V39_04170 [Candidatus Mycoplasma haematobovis]|uniref:Uncharacterized protein n=1 Tax=Candidatus Mycoplasma haematobovis TaxID=432608 RepID=A0A1A9QDQ5_9MOLU|nr:hypothetical protein [Candidatus Mycoplasma haematobovis]OAL10085.1 hypothetical protein A6V39_04170 [Candidatus Mycoplasma haematobovis]